MGANSTEDCEANFVVNNPCRGGTNSEFDFGFAIGDNHSDWDQRRPKCMGCISSFGNGGGLGDLARVTDPL